MEPHSQETLPLTPASKLKRALACGIDVLPISFVVYTMGQFVLPQAAGHDPNNSLPGAEPDGSLDLARIWFSRMTIYLIWTTYSFVKDQSTWQGTLGKKLMGIKVVDINGQRLEWKQSLIRNLGKWMGLPLVLLILWPLIDRKGQGLYDKIAKTYVVKSGPASP